MRAPRIVSSTTEAPPFGGDLPARLGALTSYTSVSDTRELPAVSAVPSPALPQLRQRADVAPLITLALLVTSAVTLLLALTVLMVQEQPTATDGGPTGEPIAAVSVSSRAGVGSVHCLSDVMTVMVTRTAITANAVMIGAVDAPQGSVQLVLHPAGGKYVGYVYVDNGVLRANGLARGFNVWPGQRLILRVNGLLDAQELRVVGRQTRLGSRADGPCS